MGDFHTVQLIQSWVAGVPTWRVGLRPANGKPKTPHTRTAETRRHRGLQERRD